MSLDSLQQEGYRYGRLSIGELDTLDVIENTCKCSKCGARVTAHGLKSGHSFRCVVVCQQCRFEMEV